MQRLVHEFPPKVLLPSLVSHRRCHSPRAVFVLPQLLGHPNKRRCQRGPAQWLQQCPALRGAVGSRGRPLALSQGDPRWSG